MIGGKPLNKRPVLFREEEGKRRGKETVKDLHAPGENAVPHLKITRRCTRVSPLFLAQFLYARSSSWCYLRNWPYSTEDIE